MKKTIIFLFSLIITCHSSFGQLTTNATLTPTQYVQDVLLGAGVVASNISFTGSPQAMASFNFGSPTSLGFGAGLLLSTGKTIVGTNGPQGPNDDEGGFYTNFSLPGDADLAAIAGLASASDLHDAAILEFDFIPQSDSVKFNYIFASEEYNEYVPSINDIFAFILSGVTTTLPDTNIAIVPGTNLPVAIANINNGPNTPSNGPCENCQFFRDNTNSSVDIQFDGLTRVLTARHAVICGETYHIKIVIADQGDGVWDSGVFLEAGSFSSSAPFQIVSGGTNMGPIGDATTIYENCGFLALNFTRPTDVSGLADTLVLTIAGNAIPGSDYTGLNDSVVFPAGEDTVTMQIFAIPDGFGDAGDSIYIYYTFTNPCNIVDTVEIVLTIQENSTPMAMAYFPNDTTVCQGQPAHFVPVPSGGAQPYSYLWQNQAGSTVATTNVFNPSSVIQTYTYTVLDACHHYFLTDSVHVNVNPVLYLSGTLDVLGSSNDSVMTEGCGTAVLTFTENGGGAGIGIHKYKITVGGTANDLLDLGVSLPDSVTFNNQTTVSYTLTAINEGNYTEGNETHIVTITYNGNPCIPVTGQLVKRLTIKDPVPLEIDLTNDTTLCKGRSMGLHTETTGGGGVITYTWQHNTNLTTADISIVPNVTQTFYVSVHESCNDSTKKDSVTVTVLYNPPVVTSLSVDTVCIGENYVFNTVLVPGTGTGTVTGTWKPGYSGDLQSTGNNSWTVFSAQESSTYIYIVTDECLVVDWDTLKLIAKDCTPVVPNIITSNGDKVNDTWVIKNLDENPETVVAVFDRWGKKVYSSSNYDNKWSPTDLNDGVYFYFIEPKKRDRQSGYLHIFNQK